MIIPSTVFDNQRRPSTELNILEAADRIRACLGEKGKGKSEIERQVVAYLSFEYRASEQTIRTIFRVNRRFEKNPTVSQYFSFSDLALLAQVKADEDVEEILEVKRTNPSLTRAGLKDLIRIAKCRADGNLEPS